MLKTTKKMIRSGKEEQKFSILEWGNYDEKGENRFFFLKG